MKPIELRCIPFDRARDLRSEVGKRISGGCDDCDAYYEVKEKHCPDAVICSHIFHDATCPYLAGMSHGEAQS